MPDKYRASLEKLADHLTFNKRLSDFLEQNGLDRNEIVDAIYWSIGMIMYNATFIVS